MNRIIFYFRSLKSKRESRISRKMWEKEGESAKGALSQVLDRMIEKEENT